MAVLSIVTPEYIADALFLKDNKEVVVKTEVKKEPVVVEVEKNVEWFYFVATGYSANDSAQGTNSTTATGTQVEEGIIAVVPGYYTLGTELEIKGLGTFIAEDTGGKIKGNRIDIYFDSKQEAKDFGVQDVWIKLNESGHTAGPIL
ncbi:MAG: 3D domain-containing protein [Actinomycetota bacterium]|nr:3D domain-containing protein [Actinomycetota bacterium]